MGATNHTANYNLPQFIGTDKPAWLSDFNGAMSDIDTAIKNASDAAAQAQNDATSAGNTAAANTGAINTIDNQLNTPVTGLAAVVADHTTDIGALESLAGNTPLDTTAQTLTAAVNEVKASADAANSNLSGKTLYRGYVDFTAAHDGNKTISDGIIEVATALKNWITSHPGQIFKFNFLSVEGFVGRSSYDKFQNVYSNETFISIALWSGLTTPKVMVSLLSDQAPTCLDYTNGSVVDRISTIMTAALTLRIDIYDTIA